MPNEESGVIGFGDLSQLVLSLDIKEFIELWSTEDRIGIKAASLSFTLSEVDKKDTS